MYVMRDFLTTTAVVAVGVLLLLLRRAAKKLRQPAMQSAKAVAARQKAQASFNRWRRVRLFAQSTLVGALLLAALVFGLANQGR